MDSNQDLDDFVKPIIDGILDREGSAYTNDPNDRGGPTKYGITQATLTRLWQYDVEPQEVEELTEQDAREIYRDLYIHGPQFHRIEDSILREHVIDAGVNHGVGWAARRLQEVAGVRADGILGPITLNAVNGADVKDIHLRFCARRFQKYANIVAADPSQARFIRGWINRANDMMLKEVDR